MPNQLTLSNGQRINFVVETGELVAVNERSSTRIQQSAPTVLTDKLVLPGTVSANTSTSSELWLRLDDGVEKPFRLSNVQVPMRPGHRISLLGAGPDGHKEGWGIGVRNHTTQTTAVDVVAGVGKSLRQWKLKVGAAGTALVTVVACVSAGAAAVTALSDTDPVGHAAVGGLLGIVGAILLTPMALTASVGRRAAVLIQEIEAFGRARLAERDSASSEEVCTPAASSDQAPASGGVSGLTVAAATIVLLSTGYVAWRVAAAPSNDHSSATPPAIFRAHNTADGATVASSGRHRDWSSYNEAQHRRQAELLARLPSQSDLDAVPPSMRPAAASLAVLYTLFPRGHEKPFPQIVEALAKRNVLHSGQPLALPDTLLILQQLDAASVQLSHPTAFDVAVAIDAGKSVFAFSGATMLRVTAVERGPQGQISAFMALRSGQGSGETIPAVVAEPWASSELVVSTGRSEF